MLSDARARLDAQNVVTDLDILQRQIGSVPTRLHTLPRTDSDSITACEDRGATVCRLPNSRDHINFVCSLR